MFISSSWGQDMELKQSIFDSKSEVKLFRSLQTTWFPRFALYPQLPLSKIVQLSDKEVSKGEFDFYLKTNVDYTFCDEGKPVLSIEFDGMGGGYSREGQYISDRITMDPYRKLKMDAKLKFTREVGYPLIVVSDKEGYTIGAGESLMILDGILGRILEEREKQKGLTEIEAEAAKRDLSDEEIQDLVTDATTGAKMENPIGRKAQEYWFLCLENQSFSEKTDYLFDPPYENNCLFMPMSSNNAEHFSTKNIEKSFEVLRTAKEVGCRYTASIGNIASWKEIWIRNFIGLGFLPHSITEDIAKYITLKNLCQQLPKN
jgi:hypothetical protein